MKAETKRLSYTYAAIVACVWGDALWLHEVPFDRWYFLPLLITLLATSAFIIGLVATHPYKEPK